MVTELIKKGLRNPGDVPGYVGRKWLRIGRKWRTLDNGAVTFDYGGFVASPRSRSEYSAKLFHEASTISDLLAKYTSESCERGLEIGCGYGRLTPWISRHCETQYGVDINQGALKDGDTQFPDINFLTGSATDLPLHSGSFDLIVSWTVLQHIPPENIEEATSEINRLLSPNGTFIACEAVEELKNEHTWGRNMETYDGLFPQMDIVESHPKPVETTWYEQRSRSRPPESIMVFQ